jgi:O-antigen/teichoic acid export membrane protein
MKQIINRFLRTEGFAKNAFVLTVGTSIAQGFPLIFYPILGRIFTPSEFGLLATLTSITAILVVLTTGKYESSILITESKKDAANIVGLVLLLSFSILVFSLIVLQLISDKFIIWFDEPEIKKWLFVCPISAFAIIIFSCYNEWCVRNKYFVRLSWNKIINAASTTLGKLFFGFVKIVSNGLVVGDVIGRLITAGVCTISALKTDRTSFFQISFAQMRHLAKRYVEFPKYILPAQLINTFGVSLPVLMIGFYFNSVEVGYYAMTMNVLSVPVSVISMALKDVFRQRANEEYDRIGNCLDIYLRLLKILLILGIISFLVLFFALPEIFSIVLGKQWRTAGEYSQILLPMITVNFVSESLDGVFIIAEKLQAILFLQIYYVSITVISLLIGFLIFKDMKSCLICFTCGRISAYSLNLVLAYKYAKGDQSNV